jgi:hypothetical protein
MVNFKKRNNIVNKLPRGMTILIVILLAYFCLRFHSFFARRQCYSGKSFRF